MNNNDYGKGQPVDLPSGADRTNENEPPEAEISPRRTKARNIALRLAYDGSAYAGWQRQKNARTVQGCVEGALSKLTHESICLYGCSRTDAGVHALGHVSNFHTDCAIPTARLPLALAALLPPDIVCLAAAEADGAFNARFAARGKQYSYYIWNAPYALPFLARYACHEPRPLCLKAMADVAEQLIGEHDFSAFQAQGSPSASTRRRLYSVRIAELRQAPFHPLSLAAENELSRGKKRGSDKWAPLHGVDSVCASGWPLPKITLRSPDGRVFPESSDEAGLNRASWHGLLRIVVHGSGFLYNMMRIVSGTLLYVGLDRLSPRQIDAALTQGDRLLLGKTLPPQGLCLDNVDYTEDPFNDLPDVGRC